MSVNRRQARHGRNRDYSKSGSVGIAEAAQNIRNKVSLKDILELTPIAGDLLAAKEVYDEMKKENPNYYLVGILTAGTIVGLVPGVGDAAAQAIKIGGRAAIKGTKKAVDTLSQYGLEIDPSTLGSNLGNVRIVKKGRPGKPREFTVEFPDGTKQTMSGDNAIQSIADATGKSKKTIQNAFAEGRVIKGSNGETYTPAGTKAKPDARIKTEGQLQGYDGSFSDLMKEYGIDPRSGEADNIRKHLRRGGDFEGIRFKDAPDLEAKKAQNIEESRARGIEVRNKFMDHRMKTLGLPPEAREEFSKIWRTPLDKKKVRGTGAPSKHFTLTNEQKMDIKFTEDPVEREKLLKQAKRSRITGSPKYAEWRRFFKKWKPELLKGTTAQEQKDEIYELLTSTFTDYRKRAEIMGGDPDHLISTPTRSISNPIPQNIHEEMQFLNQQAKDMVPGSRWHNLNDELQRIYTLHKSGATRDMVKDGFSKEAVDTFYSKLGSYK